MSRSSSYYSVFFCPSECQPERIHSGGVGRADVALLYLFSLFIFFLTAEKHRSLSLRTRRKALCSLCVFLLYFSVVNFLFNIVVTVQVSDTTMLIIITNDRYQKLKSLDCFVAFPANDCCIQFNIYNSSLNIQHLK